MRLYDSLTRTLQEVDPIEPGHVTMYACGPTVYRYAHLGNLRSFMLYDLIRRALSATRAEARRSAGSCTRRWARNCPH